MQMYLTCINQEYISSGWNKWFDQNHITWSECNHLTPWVPQKHKPDGRRDTDAALNATSFIFHFLQSLGSLETDFSTSGSVNGKESQVYTLFCW